VDEIIDLYELVDRNYGDPNGLDSPVRTRAEPTNSIADW